MTTNPTSTRIPQSGWIAAALLVHLPLVVGLVAYLCLYVPRQGRVYEEFGLELPVAVNLLITLSSFVRSTWYAVLPFLIGVVLAIDIGVVFLIRSAMPRTFCLAALAVLPLVCLAIWHMLLLHATATLVDSLS